MWVAEFRAWHDSWTSMVTRECDAEITTYYLNYFNERGKRYVSKVAEFSGREKEKALALFCRDPRIRVLEKTAGGVVYQLPEKEGFHHFVLDRTTFLVEPVLCRNGSEYWKVGSTSKKNLLNLYRNIRKLGRRAGIELLGIREERPRFYKEDALSHLTHLQCKAVKAAKAAGYYEYPRKVSAQQLARKEGVPASTFIERLRKAETRLMARVLGP